MFDDTDRKNEKRLGIILMLPAFFVIVLPIAYFAAISVMSGRDEFGPLRDLVNHYHVALLIPMIICLACLLASVPLVRHKDDTGPLLHDHHR